MQNMVITLYGYTFMHLHLGFRVDIKCKTKLMLTTCQYSSYFERQFLRELDVQLITTGFLSRAVIDAITWLHQIHPEDHWVQLTHPGRWWPLISRTIRQTPQRCITCTSQWCDTCASQWSTRYGLHWWSFYWTLIKLITTMCVSILSHRSEAQRSPTIHSAGTRLCGHPWCWGLRDWKIVAKSFGHNFNTCRSLTLVLICKLDLPVDCMFDPNRQSQTRLCIDSWTASLSTMTSQCCTFMADKCLYWMCASVIRCCRGNAGITTLHAKLDDSCTVCSDHFESTCAPAMQRLSESPLTYFGWRKFFHNEHSWLNFGRVVWPIWSAWPISPVPNNVFDWSVKTGLHMCAGGLYFYRNVYQWNCIAGVFDPLSAQYNVSMPDCNKSCECCLANSTLHLVHAQILKVATRH